MQKAKTVEQIKRLELLGLFLTEEMKKKKMRLADIHRKTGIDRDTIRKIMRGEQNPSLLTLLEITKVIGVGVNFKAGK